MPATLRLVPMSGEQPDHQEALRSVSALEAVEDRAFQRGQESAQMKGQLASHERRLDAINGSIRRSAEAQENTNDRLDTLTASVEKSTAVAKARSDTAAELAKQAAQSAVDKRTFIVTAVACSAAIASALIAAIALGLGH